MLRSYLSPVARRVGQLEAMQQAAGGQGNLSINEQAQVCRNLLAACACGHVERTLDGYRAITDPNTWHEPFEIEPGRWEKRCKIVPEIAEEIAAAAEFLNALFARTGKYFPVYEGIANQPDAQFLAAVYRHYGVRFLEQW